MRRYCQKAQIKDRARIQRNLRDWNKGYMLGVAAIKSGERGLEKSRRTVPNSVHF